MNPSLPLALLALLFAAFAAVLLAVPPWLVRRKAQPWWKVRGLWVAGWGFLLIAAGTNFSHLGWGNVVVVGVLVAGAGHLMQRSAESGKGR